MIEKIFNLYLKFFLIGCSVFYIAGQQFYAPQEMFFQYGVMAFFGLCLWVPKKRDTSNFFLFLIFSYAVFNTVLFHFEPQNRMILNNLFFSFILIKILSERISLDFKMIGNLLALFCAFNVFWLTLQILNVDPIFSSMNPQNMPQVDHVGFMALRSNLGILACLSLPFIFIANPFSAVICLPLLYYGQSSTCIAAFGLTVLFLLWFKRRRLFWISLVVIILSSVFYVFKIDMPTGEFSKRFNVWGAGVNYVAGSSPWFGKGLGAWATTGFTTLQKNGQPETWLWAHNEFIQYLFELGLIGMVLLYAYFKDVFKKINLWDSRHQTAISILIPVLVISVFHFPFHLGRFAGLLCFMFASVEALLNREEA